MTKFISSVLVMLGLSGCVTIMGESMKKQVQSKPEDVKAYYLSVLPGELGCEPKNLRVEGDLTTSGMCGSVDTLTVACKDARFICTMTSTITGGGNVNMAGITQSFVCQLTPKCSPLKN